MATSPPKITHVLETCLYTKSQEKSRQFYKGILGLETMFESERGTGYPLANTDLLIFTLGLTTEDIVDTNMHIPKHGPTEGLLNALSESATKSSGSTTEALRQHFCFALGTRAEVEQWEQHFIANDVPIIGRSNWERGGYSIYFADPDGHVGEIASRGIWPNY